MACAIFFISVTTGFLFLRETLSSKKNHRDWGLLLGRSRLAPSTVPGVPAASTAAPSSTMKATAPLLPRINMSSSEVIHAEIEPPTMAEIFTTQTIINLVSLYLLGPSLYRPSIRCFPSS